MNPLTVLALGFFAILNPLLNAAAVFMVFLVFGLGAAKLIGNVLPATTEEGVKTELVDCAGIPADLQGYLGEMATFSGVPANFLAAIGQIESAWQPEADSGDARGLMQLGYSEAAGYTYQGLDRRYQDVYEKQFGESLTGRFPDDADNPRYNIFLGAMYLKELLARYDQDQDMAAAAYNWGMGNVDALKDKSLESLPSSSDHVNDVRGYVESMRTHRDAFADCMEEVEPEEETPGAGTAANGDAVTNANAEKIREAVAAGFAAQCRGNTCYRNATIGGEGERGLLTTLFDWSQGTGYGSHERSSTVPPTSGELDQLRTTLRAGNIPVWHIKGDYGNEHWILVLGIDSENRIEFYDPNDKNVGGSGIRTLPYDHQVSYAGRTYRLFGIVDPTSGREFESDQYFRGYEAVIRGSR